MCSIDNKKILKISSICILLGIPFLDFFSGILKFLGVINNFDFINPAIILYALMPVLLFIYLYDLIANKRKPDIFDYLFYLLIFAGILSTAFAIDKQIAIFGKDFRHEGLLSVLSYYLLFINWKYNGNRDDICKFIKLITIIAIVNSIYALLQMYTDISFISRYYINDTNMAMGLCGNPNFFGSLIVTVLSIVATHFIFEKKFNIKECLIIILLFISLINSQSTGPFLTFIVVLLFLIIFLKIKNCLVIRKLLILLLVLIDVFISIYLVNNYIYKTVKYEFSLSGIEETIDSGGNGRLKIWKNSLGIVKDNFLVGVGFDNFYLAYPNPKIDNSFSYGVTSNKVELLTPKNYYIVDCAHNVYLHTFVTTGILGFIPYFLLCFLTFIKGLKSKNKLMFLLLSGFVAYSIQAFANISVIEVAPIYYIIIGLMLSIKG